jgi:coenzyme Q-binding protein COQ10
MPQYSMTRRVSVSPAVAYAVAADVAAYKSFLPMLQKSVIRGAKAKRGTGEEFLAELVVGYEKLGIKETFVSKVVTDPVARTVSATSQEGPLQSLNTSWSVTEAPGGSDVSISIDYAFRNKLMQVAFSGLLDMAAARIMTAFEERARLLASGTVL